jgi:hypothetical protein
MATTHDLVRQAKRPARGPHIAFVGCVLLVFLALALSGRALPQDLVTPLIVTLLFGLAAFVTIAAVRKRRGPVPARLTYWDVAGALLLIGIGLSALIEPDQMVRLVEGDGAAP